MMEPVTILQFTDEGSVYISNNPHTDLVKIEQEANEFVSNRQFRDDNLPPRKGETCLAHNNGRWSRGEVRRAFVSIKHGTIAEVFLIDHGRSVNIPLQQLVLANDSPTLCSTPPLAILYCLSFAHITGLPDAVNPPWSEAVTNIFNNLMDGVDNNGWGTPAQSVIREGIIEIYHQSSNGQMISFNNILISSGFLVSDHEYTALPTSDCSVYSPRVFVESPDTHSTLDESSESYNTPITPPSNINKFLPSKPNIHQGVYIEGASKRTAWSELEDTPFSPSVCSSLKGRGFRYPTAIQCYGWPLIWEGKDSILLSQSNSGKTLAYLLPLLCQLTDMLKNVDQSYEPSVLILVSESYKAWIINEQVRTILSWLNAALRFRTCAAYFTVEHDAICHILNGINIIVATPPSLLRLIHTKILTLSNLKHLVLDDVYTLHQKFATDVAKIIHIYDSHCTRHQSNWHMIACFSKYMSHPWEWIQQYLRNPVTIVTNPLELVVLKRLKYRIISSSFPAHLISVLAQNNNSSANSSKIIVAVSSIEEADRLIQILSISSINAVHWVKDTLPSACDVTVISDISLPTVDITEGVSHLIHYSLPTDKSVFTKRHSLIIPTLLSSAHATPSLMVFIDDNSINQSKDLVQLMERLGQPMPNELLLLAGERKKIQQRKERLYNLCCYVKAYGECLIGTDCKMAHSVAELSDIRNVIPKPHLPRNGVVKVKVEYVTSPVQIWVRILDHTPLYRGDAPVISSGPTLGQLSLDLAIYYSSPDNHVLHSNPLKGDYCGLRQPTGECYRVIVLDFSSPLGLYFHHKEKAKVRLIDRGQILIVDANQLLSLPNQYMNIPPLVIETYICGLIPLDNDIDWPPESSSIAHKLFNDRILIGCVAVAYSDTMWLDPVEERVVLEGLKISTALIVPQKEVVKNGLGCIKNDHLDNVCKMLNMQKYGGDLQNWITCDECRKVTLSEIEGVEVSLTAIESLSSVYVKQVSTESLLQSITERLNPPVTGQTSNTGFENYFRKIRFRAGQMCSALFPHDKTWYRVCIMKVNEITNSTTDDSDSDNDIVFNAIARVEYQCLFVDYGDLEWVGPKEVEPISPQLLEFPFQAVQCSFHGREDITDNDIILERIWDTTRERSLKLKIMSPNDEPSVVLSAEDGSNVLLQCYCTTTDVLEEREEQTQSETTSILILMHQGQIPVLQFLYHVLNNKNKIALLDEDMNIIISLMKHDDAIIKGVLLLLVTQPQYILLFSSHTTFGHILIDIISNPNSLDVLSSSLQLLKLIYLETKCDYSMIVDVNTVLRIIGNVYLGSTNITVLSNAIHIVICLVTTHQQLRDHPIFDKLIQHLPELLTKDILVCSCIRLLCVLIELEIANDVIIIHLKRITRNMSSWPPEVREWLLYFVLFSSNSTITDSFNNIWSQLTADGSLTLSPIEQNITDSDINGMTHDRDGSSITNSHSIADLTPKVLWSQTRYVVCLSVQVRGCEQQQQRVKINDNVIAFRCLQMNSVYSFSLELFGKITQDKCPVEVKGGEIVIKLIKEQCIYWPRLSCSKTKPSFVAVDYNRWREDSSDSNEEGPEHDRCIPWNELRGNRNEDDYPSDNHNSDNSTDDYNIDCLLD